MKGTGKFVLYLDFDGVLHDHRVLWHPRVGAYLNAPDEYKLFQHSQLLEQLLAPFPQVQIVLSTTWVRRYGCTTAAKNLRPVLRQKVIGATFHMRMNEDEFAVMPRGMQVWSDVLRRRPRDWLALDDDSQDWPEWCVDKYIRTHAHAGISHPEVQDEFKAKLIKMCT